MLLSLSLAFAQDVSIRDALSSGTTATTVYGGSFTGSGWRVDDSNSRLFWDFGKQVGEGSVSFTTDDITFENLTGDNNEFIQLFDTGDKWSCTHAVTMRVYGSDDGSSWGDIKLKTWDNASGLWSEARGGVQDWDGGPHTWTINWSSTEATLARDGVQIVWLDTTGQDLNVGTLWLPLNTWGSGYSHPIGSVYSNLAFDGWSGGSDGGDDGGGDGVPTDGGRAPIEDVGASQGYGDSVYDATDDLPLESSIELSYLMFDLSDVVGTVTSATLNVHAQSDSHAEGDGGLLYQVSDTSWSEDTLTWNNRPALGAAVSSFGSVVPSDSLSFDVTSFVTAGGRAAFAMANGGSNGAHFWSKEGDEPPSLVLEWSEDGGSGDDGTGDDGSGDDGSDDGGSGDGSGSDDKGDNGADTADFGAPGGAEMIDGQACACGTTDAAGSLLAAGAAALGLVRRRK